MRNDRTLDAELLHAELQRAPVEPRRVAAPRGPAITHRVSFSVARMCARSASWSLPWRRLAAPASDPIGGAAGIVTSRTSPDDRITDRSIALRKSRLLAGPS
jgi:hypothetical protein